MKPDVVIVPCADYAHETARTALKQALAPLGGLDWVNPGMKIAVKVNLVASAKPEVSPDSREALNLLMSSEGFPHPPEEGNG